jgi:restriction system protein
MNIPPNSVIYSAPSGTKVMHFGRFPPEVTLQAVVERIGDADDGSIISTLGPAWVAIMDLLAQDPDALHKLTDRQFEELIAATYDKAGYDEVILTPRSGDFGRDVIAIKRGWGSIRIIDQAKKYKPGHLVTANDVRALSGVLHGDPKATKGIVTTTSAFAPRIEVDPYLAPLMPFRLELVNGEDLKARLQQLQTGCR